MSFGVITFIYYRITFNLFSLTYIFIGATPFIVLKFISVLIPRRQLILNKFYQ